MNITLSSGNKNHIRMDVRWAALLARYAREAAESAAHQPIIGTNGNWWTWNQESGAYADTGQSAAGTSGAATPAQIAEALACTPLGGLGALVTEENNGKVVAIRNGAFAAAAITELIADGDEVSY